MTELDMSVWTGRVDQADGPKALRWHQMVKPLASDGPPGVVLIGFACDEGVRRNQGRVGAKDGPRAIRAALANMAWHHDHPIYDAGDVRCDDGDLEGAQKRLAEVVASTIASGHLPLVLGGGHETAWGTFQGIVASRPTARVGVLNIDAHFDLRNDETANSGTPFSQIARWCWENDRDFYYMCAGIAAPSNTRALFERASELGVRWQLDSELDPWNLNELPQDLERFAQQVECLHLSIDLDVLPAAVMPAVSAPAARGVSQEVVSTLIGWIIRNVRVAAVDLVELNPQLDSDGRASRVAARLAWDIATYWTNEEAGA